MSKNILRASWLRQIESELAGRADGKRLPHPLRPQVEALEERTLLSGFADTTVGIHIFMDQLGNLSPQMTHFLATHVDGTEKQTPEQIAALRAVNPNFGLITYRLGTMAGPPQYIINGRWSSDFGTVTTHEDWFLHQTYSGEPQSAADLASGRIRDTHDDSYAMDIANPSWQNYWLNSELQNLQATGADGVFADSFTYGIGGAGYDAPPPRYQRTNAADSAYWPGGVTWTTQLGNWAKTIESTFASYNAAHGTHYEFLPNLDGRATSWEPAWYYTKGVYSSQDPTSVPFVDGAFLEGFGGFTDTYNWRLSMDRGLDLTRNGKTVIMQPYTDPTNQQQIDFLLGTYLLLKGNPTYLAINATQYFPEYQVNIGAPTTPIPTAGQGVDGYLWNGVYRRDFQNGFVLVNPGSTAYTLNLGGTYQLVQGHGGGALDDGQLDANGNYIGGYLTYQNMSSVTLAGSSAAIFLNSTTRSSPTIVTPAAASSNPVTGKGVNLSVLAQEGGNDSGLKYTWTVSGPAGVSFANNGTNAAKNTTAAFGQAGTYTFTATAADAGNQSATSTIVVTVSQTLSSIRVSAASATLANGATDQFSATAFDQFGSQLGAPPAFTWSLAAGGVGGTVSATGLYTAPASGAGTATVVASSGAVSGSAGVQVAAPSGGAAFVRTDGSTGGNWATTYGTDGYDIAQLGAALPAYAQVALGGNADYTWAYPTTDPRAVVQPGSSNRIAACWYSGGTFTIDVQLTDGQTHQIALYALDWDNYGPRQEQVTVRDAATGQPLDSRTVSGFTGGQYLVWNVRGHVQFQVTNLVGNAVISGLFFGGPAAAQPSATASFAGLDTTTQGRWRSAYGADGYNIAADGYQPPAYAKLSSTGAYNYTWAAATSDPRALTKADGSSNIAACWYTGGLSAGSSYTIDLDLTDGKAHQVALAALDWDNSGPRSQRVDVLDASTGALLDSRTVSNFSSGQYLVWNLSGHVQFKVTNLINGTNAVISGLFFGGPAAAKTTTYQASADFSATQGSRGWSYLDSNGNPMTWSNSWNAWQGNETYLLLWGNGGHPGSGADAVRRWTAPQAGSIHITGNAHEADPRGGDGVTVSILRNGQVLWQQAIANNNATGFNFDLTTVVAAGDRIDFIINKNSNHYYDTTFFDPTIVLTTV